MSTSQIERINLVTNKSVTDNYLNQNKNVKTKIFIITLVIGTCITEKYKNGYSQNPI